MSVLRLLSPPSSLDGDTLAERMERLRADASALAAEHTNALVQAVNDAASLADQVAGGGEAYGVGVRDMARRLHADLAAKALSLQAIRERVH